MEQIQLSKIIRWEQLLPELFGDRLDLLHSFCIHMRRREKCSCGNRLTYLPEKPFKPRRRHHTKQVSHLLRPVLKTMHDPTLRDSDDGSLPSDIGRDFGF